LLSGVLLTLIILSLTYVIHELKSFREDFVIMMLLTVEIISLTSVFVYRIKTTSNPLIDVTLLKKRSTLTGNGVIVLMGAFFTGYLFIISLVLQVNMQFSAATAGLILLPFSIFSAVVSKFFIPMLLKRISISQLAIMGMSFMALGGVALICALAFHYNILALLISIACVTGAGIAVCFNSLMVIAMQEIPVEHHGLASGIANTSYFFGAGLGLSVIGLFMQLESQPANRMLPAIVLCVYALGGLMWLVVAYKRNPKIQAA
jgi:MFS family permease